MNIEAAELIDLICTHLFFLFFSILSTWIHWRVVYVVYSPTSFFDSPWGREQGQRASRAGVGLGLSALCDERRIHSDLPVPSSSTTATCSESARLFVLPVKMPIHLRRDNTHLWEVSDTRYLRIVAGQPTSSGPRRR